MTTTVPGLESIRYVAVGRSRSAGQSSAPLKRNQFGRFEISMCNHTCAVSNDLCAMVCNGCI